MERQPLLDEIMRRMGATRVEDAERALAATLPALGSWLGTKDGALVQNELPEGLHRLLGAAGVSISSLDQLVQRIQRTEGVAEGYALEHAQAVGHAIYDHLTPETRQRLESEAWHALVRPSVADRHSPRLPGRHGNTIADGRPGSSHPVSESAPYSHADSVVQANNPHGDRKLSSGAPREGEGADWVPPLTRIGSGRRDTDDR